jgi:transposase
MSRRKVDPLRPLSTEERLELERLSRAQAEPAALVARAKALLAVANGHTYTKAALLVGRKSGDAVAELVGRFNREGLAALEPGHGGGQPKRYTSKEQERILREVRRKPNREEDGTASWSLSTLTRALRRAPDGLPTVSSYTVWLVLRESGFVWTKDRSWCETGTALRKRKSGTVTVEDPDALAKRG